jgi:NTE family protein
MALSLEKNDVVDMAMPDNGFIKGEKLEHYVNTALKNANLETLRIPFYAVATDIRNGKEVIFGKGNSGIAVRSSCSVPGVFRPVKIADRFYVDGGLVSPIAVDAARKYGADIVIAVDVSSPLESFVPETTIETILQSVDIMYSKISESQLQKADVIIRPLVGNFGSADFTRRHEAILEGEKAAIKALPAINQILSKLRHEGRL